MFGLLTELGNLLFSEESLKTDEYRKTGIPTPIYNPNAWTRLGHVLSFDQPAPIGFSYCGNNSDPNNITHPHSCNGIVWNDELTAQAAYKALVSFYDKFPMYYSLDLYLTGESYAGIYIPTLAREILHHNDDVNSDVTLPLRGFAVGDGCLGTDTGICGNLDSDSGFDVWNAIFLAGHGQIPLTTFHTVMQACYHTSLPSHLHSNDFVSTLLRGLRPESIASSEGSEITCQEALKIMDEQVGGVYAYG
jgi:serine carboxypeptidase-like clade I